MHPFSPWLRAACFAGCLGWSSARAQDQGREPLVPTGNQSPPATQPSPAVVTTRGGIEAPKQPDVLSSSSYSTTPRVVPKPGKGTNFHVSTRLSNLVDVRGQEENQLVGVGLVTGLGGTGDSVNMTRQLLQNLLLAHNVKIDPQQLTPKNIALVRVEAALPPGIVPGRSIDVRVSTLGDCKSLQGGTLTLMELTDISGQVVYATAAGPINVGGFLAEGEGATTQQNHVTVGTIPGGGKVERAVPSQVVSEHGYVYLDARASHSTFGTQVRITEVINKAFPGAAEAAGEGRTVKVRVPSDLPRSAHVAYLDAILRLEVEPEQVARVVISERTGMVVIGEGVRLQPGAVARGNLTINVAESPQVSQPGPLSGGSTEVVERTELNVTEENKGLVLIPGAITLQEVVDVLNVMGATPRDLIGIIEAMSQAGMLLAEIRRL